MEWLVTEELIPYEMALAAMERRVEEINLGNAAECVWLLEHPPLYTAGTSAKSEDLVNAGSYPVYDVGRGGQYTYHGPGQRVAYVMLDLKTRTKDVRLFVQALEQWLISTLEAFNIKGERREDRIGVWVTRPEKPKTFNGSVAEDKIAALGIRLRKWVTFHGISINVNPELAHFDGIVACGVKDHGVTSFEDLGHLTTLFDVDAALRSSFEEIFGPTVLGEVSGLIQTP